MVFRPVDPELLSCLIEASEDETETIELGQYVEIKATGAIGKVVEIETDVTGPNDIVKCLVNIDNCFVWKTEYELH